MNKVQHSDKKTGDIASILLAHYAVNARVLPWRAVPGSALPNPYHVWLSEIMLQQTTVAAVMSYFEKFTTRWPDFAALAAADDADVMAAWAGLGYYARARNLLACARVVVADYAGQLPVAETDLLRLPGIGAYTAAAISAIAYGRRAVVVDANVERVVSRLFAIRGVMPSAKPAIRAATDSITPDQRSGDFAQALMDLGAGYCSVRTPSCNLCPLAEYCRAYQAGDAAAYPVKAKKKAKPARRGTAYWFEHDGHVLLVQRPASGMLGGMRALPDDGWSSRTDGDSSPPVDAVWRELDQIVQHEFTHFTLSLRIAVTAIKENDMPPIAGEFWPLNSLDKAGLPTLFLKAARAVTNDSGRREIN